MADGKLTAALDDIRRWVDRRAGQPDWRAATEASADSVPRLLAAVDAVLDQHRPGRIAVLGALCPRHEAHRYFSITSIEAADVAACAHCQATVFDSCAGCGSSVRLDSCPVRTAISRALLGEEGTAGD